MLRLYKSGTNTWRSLQTSKALRVLERKIEETPELHNARVACGASAVVYDPYAIVCVYVQLAEGGMQEHVMWDEEDTYFAPVRGGLLIRTHNALYEHCGAVSGRITQAYSSRALRRIHSAPRAQYVSDGKPFVVRISRFVLFVRANVSHVVLLPRPKNRVVQRHMPPSCVNACFTTAVDGALPTIANLERLTQSASHGVCGSSHTTSTVFGVLEIFPPRGGVRKIIGKGYQSVRDMQFDTLWLCRLIGTSEVASISMHMCIMKGSTGMRMDISADGFLHQYLTQHLRDADGPLCTFRPAVPELDVHCIVHIDHVHRLAQCLGGDDGGPGEEVAEALQELRLFLSCTGLGVCIFRVARQKNAGSAPPLALEQAIHSLCVRLHALLCTFPGA